MIYISNEGSLNCTLSALYEREMNGNPQYMRGGDMRHSRVRQVGMVLLVLASNGSLAAAQATPEPTTTTHEEPATPSGTPDTAQETQAAGTTIRLSTNRYNGVLTTSDASSEHPVYEFTAAIRVRKCVDGGADVSPAETRSVEEGWRFRVYEQGDDYVRIRFLRWSGDDNPLNNLVRAASSETQNDPVFWCFDSDAVTSSVRTTMTRWIPFQTSALILPYKLRFGGDHPSRQFDFVSDVTIGASIGAGIRLTRHFSLGAVVAVGPTLISIADGAGSTSNHGAFTFATGLTFAGPGVNLAVLTGADYLASRGSLDWAYHGKWWLGLSVGVNIYDVETERGSNSSD